MGLCTYVGYNKIWIQWQYREFWTNISKTPEKFKAEKKCKQQTAVSFSINNFTLVFIYTIFPWSALRQVLSLFQSEFSKECDLVLP
jgi:hypothetical protein